MHVTVVTDSSMPARDALLMPACFASLSSSRQFGPVPRPPGVCRPVRRTSFSSFFQVDLVHDRLKRTDLFSPGLFFLVQLDPVHGSSEACRPVLAVLLVCPFSSILCVGRLKLVIRLGSC